MCVCTNQTRLRNETLASQAVQNLSLKYLFALTPLNGSNRRMKK